jgi:hypothetical protein
MIKKLRIIMLYEADFNFVLKLIWGRRLVRHAEKYKCLGTSNHVLRAGRQTVDALLEKLLCTPLRIHSSHPHVSRHA